MAETIKGFPWRAGCSTADGKRVFEITSGGYVWATTDREAVFWHLTSRAGQTMAPDRADVATRGVFLDAVREAFGERFLYISPGPGAWFVCRTVEEQLGMYVDEVLLVDGTWFPRDEFNNEHPPIRAATEWDAIEAAWNVRPGRAG